MSDINLRRPETIVLAPAAEAVAYELLAKFEAQLSIDTQQTDRAAHDYSAAKLRDGDISIQAEIDATGADSVYFGHTNGIDPLLYDALVKGYDPTPEQLEAAETNGGHNFLWDQILKLPSEHPDVDQTLRRFGYGSKETPVPSTFVGAYIVPRDTARAILATLFMRGQEYKEWGWGFPHWSEDNTGTTEATQQ